MRPEVRWSFVPLAAALLLLPVLGCVTPPPERDAPTGAYFGRTEPIGSVIDQINANAGRVPSLWAVGTFEATIAEARDARATFVNGDAVLLHADTDDVLLVGKKPVAGRVFEAGSNGDRYWLVVYPDELIAWTGTLERVDRVDPELLPIRPDAVLEVLGVSTIGTDLHASPVATMRFNNDDDAYMFLFSERTADRWSPTKEVWYDRASKLPILVLLYGSDGRVAVRAYLHDHVEIDDDGDAPGPQVASRYELLFVETGSRLSLELTDVRLRKGRVPQPANFVFPENRLPAERIIDLDATTR